MRDNMMLGPDEGPVPGLIWAYRFASDGTPERIEGEALVEAIERPEGWLWLHFNLADGRARYWIERHAPVPPVARDLLLGDDEHQTLIADSDVVMGVLVDLKRALGTKTEELGRLRFVLADTMLLSARRGPLHSVDVARAALDTGHRFPSAVALLETIVQRFADSVAVVVRDISDQLDTIEDRVVLDEPSDERVRLGPLRRSALRLHRQLATLKTLFATFAEDEDGHLPQAVEEVSARMARRLDTIDRDVEGVLERARVIQDEIATKAAEQANRNTYALSVMTALLLPPTLVTGFFGMNTADLPFEEIPNGTWIAAFFIVLGPVVVYLFLRQRGVGA